MGLRGCQFTAATVELPSLLALSGDMQMFAVLSKNNHWWNMAVCQNLVPLVNIKIAGK
jgi:hypothetical protein